MQYSANCICMKGEKLRWHESSDGFSSAVWYIALPQAMVNITKYQSNETMSNTTIEYFRKP